MKIHNSMWLLSVGLFVLIGCSFPKQTYTLSGKASEVMEQATASPHNLSVLSVTGGLCLIAGMALLVVTSGRKGWYPVVGGFLLVVLNFLVAEFSHYIFIPLVVFSAMISAAWTYRTVKQILLEKKTK
tara:strand:- start:1567 stop:1950 length:384 start_codon:yes stop_codon:yes gene_type:complete